MAIYDEYTEVSVSCQIRLRVGVILFTLANFVVVILSIGVLCLLFAPQTFDRTKFASSIARRSYYDFTADPSLLNESWPIKIRTSVAHYFCQRPSPRIDISYDLAVTVWQLPSDATLSPSMFEMARCQLAAARDRDGFDASQCSCMDDFEAYKVTVTSVFFALLIAIYALCSSGSLANEDTFDSEAWSLCYKLTLVSALLSFVLAVGPGFRFIADNEFTTNSDQQLHPYYRSFEWSIISALNTVNFLINMNQVIALIVLAQLRKWSSSKKSSAEVKGSNTV